MTVRQHFSPTRRKGNLGIAMQRYFMAGHIFLYRLTGGVIGARAGWLTFLLLTTIGRKSGIVRVTPILCIPEKDRFLLIASNWGSEQDPQWWLNLQAHPQATIQVGRRILTVTARQATQEERAHMWPEITARFRNFAAYQKRLKREIPIVILTPDTQMGS